MKNKNQMKVEEVNYNTVLAMLGMNKEFRCMMRRHRHRKTQMTTANQHGSDDVEDE